MFDEAAPEKDSDWEVRMIAVVSMLGLGIETLHGFRAAVFDCAKS